MRKATLVHRLSALRTSISIQLFEKKSFLVFSFFKLLFYTLRFSYLFIRFGLRTSTFTQNLHVLVFSLWVI